MQWHQDVDSVRRSTRPFHGFCRWQWLARPLVIAAALFAAAAPAVADDESLSKLLDLAPAESDVLVIVPDMAALAEQLGMFESQIGLSMPELSNVLAQFQRTTGLTKGVKEDGPALLAVTLEREDGVVTAARTLLMIAAGDYAALASDLGVKDQTAVTAVRLATGHAANIKQQGEFAVLTNNSATLEAYQPAGQGRAILENLGSLGQDSVSAGHVSIVVHGSDVAGTLQVITNMLQGAAMQFIAAQVAGPAPAEGEQGDPAAAGIGAAGGGELGGVGGGGVGAAMAAAWSRQDLSTDVADDILRDAQSMIFAVEFNDRGISLSQSTQFKSGSDAANALGEGRSAGESMARLPQWPYMGAMAMSFEGVDLQALGDSSGGALVAGVLSDWVWQTVSNKQNKPAVTSAVQVLYEPRDVALGGAPSMTWLQTEDPKALVTALQQTLDKVNGDGADTGGGEDLVTADYTATYTPNHMKLDKYSVDQYIISPRIVQLGGSSAMTMASTMVGVAAGGDTSGFVVALDDGVIITKTTDTTVLEAFIDALGSEQRGLSDDLLLTESRHQLFEDSSIEAYLNMRSIYDAVRQNPMVGVLLNQQLPQPDESMTPIAFGLKVSQGGTSARLYVPHLVIDYANQVVQQMLAARTGQPGGRGRPRAPGLLRP